MKNATFVLCSLFLLAFAKWSLAQQQPQYTSSPNQEHYVLIILSEKWATPLEIAGQVARYNQNLNNKPTQTQLYRIPFMSKLPVITLMGFPNQNAALKYCHKLKEKRPDFMRMNIVEKLWPVSIENFNEMLRKKSTDKYEAFLLSIGYSYSLP